MDELCRRATKWWTFQFHSGPWNKGPTGKTNGFCEKKKCLESRKKTVRETKVIISFFYSNHETTQSHRLKKWNHLLFRGGFCFKGFLRLCKCKIYIYMYTSAINIYKHVCIHMCHIHTSTHMRVYNVCMTPRLVIGGEASGEDRN